MINRRFFLLSAAALGACSQTEPVQAAESDFANSSWRKLTDAQWRQRLSPQAYRTLRHEDTERPGTSPLEHEHRRGTFVCAGCELPLFKSEWKFESGTGWPSFFRVHEKNIARKRDLLMVIPRTEYHCARCLGHQGHVFPDGPAPTGLRWCNNGVALKFIPG
ncbi:MAG: peptide-methionine (R)-S-oxide reductase MsrB [Caulobacter sp.]|nr:peptide-methionine (R)-S-oxide reductase MsrB [Caulobacter sp.]